MEDDIAVKKDPKLLSDVIQELDALVGKEGWDVLYTDMDEDVFVENHIKPYFAEDNDYESELKGDLYFFWRPDLDVSDHARFKKRTVLNKSFLQVGSRSRTHSMIIRRSGMKKILEFVKQHHIFLAYDHELAIVPEIRLINLRNPVVTFIDTASDTNVDFFEGEEIWKKCSQITLSGMSNLLGWYEESQIHKLLHSMRKKKPKVCVEVGAFGGITTFPIANGLQLIEGGTLYAVDAWDQEVALQGMKGAKTIQWWKTLDLNALYEKMKTFFSQEPYRKYVHLIRKTSQEAVTLFADESIDFLVLDGNPSEKQSLEDVLSYFPKVRPGGYIWLQNAQLVSKSKALSFLFQHCHWMEEESSEMQVLFEKKLGL